MKVLLLSSPVVQPDFDRIARIPNYGLVSIAGNVDDICTVHVADLHAVKRPKEYLEGILRNGYDLVGLSCMSFQYHAMLPLAKMAQESGAETVFGGNSPNACRPCPWTCSRKSRNRRGASSRKPIRWKSSTT